MPRRRASAGGGEGDVGGDGDAGGGGARAADEARGGDGNDGPPVPRVLDPAMEYMGVPLDAGQNGYFGDADKVDSFAKLARRMTSHPRTRA